MLHLTSLPNLEWRDNMTEPKIEATQSVEEVKKERLNKLQRESSIKANVSKVSSDVLTLETQLIAMSETIDDKPELTELCKKYIPHSSGLFKELCHYLAG